MIKLTRASSGGSRMDKCVRRVLACRYAACSGCKIKGPGGEQEVGELEQQRIGWISPLRPVGGAVESLTPVRRVVSPQNLCNLN